MPLKDIVSEARTKSANTDGDAPEEDGAPDDGPEPMHMDTPDGLPPYLHIHTLDFNGGLMMVSTVMTLLGFALEAKNGN